MIDAFQSAIYISTHAPAGGATGCAMQNARVVAHFYSRPCGRGDVAAGIAANNMLNFYSRPCGRGDLSQFAAVCAPDFSFLLTPLREGRPMLNRFGDWAMQISTHAPAGGATRIA